MRDLRGWFWFPGLGSVHYYGGHPKGWNWPLCGNGNAVIPEAVARGQGQGPFGGLRARKVDDPCACKACLRVLERRRKDGEGRA